MYIRGPRHGAILSSDQGVIFRSQIFPSSEWVPGIELRSGLAASIFTAEPSHQLDFSYLS